MPSRYKFKRGVGQVAAGNIVHEGHSAHGTSHVNNVNHVVNIQLGNKRTPPFAKYVSERQRQTLFQRVAHLALLRECAPRAIYHDLIFAAFDVNEIRRLPREHYRAALALLDRHIDRHKYDSAQTPRTRMHAQRPSTRQCVCPRRAPWRYWLPALLGGATCLTLIGAGAFVMAQPATSAEAKHVPSCSYGGHVYSEGSVIRMPGGNRRECLLDAAGALHWLPATTAHTHEP